MIIIGRKTKLMRGMREPRPTVSTFISPNLLLCEIRSLQDLKSKCMSQPGNQEFWSQVTSVGRDLSLISDKEAKQHGGTSNISERKAEEVCCKPFGPEFLTPFFSQFVA